MSKAAAENPGNNSTRDWQDRDHRHYLHPFTDHKDLGNKGTRIITHAEGVYITDSEGQQILDGMAGLWCVNLGYGGKCSNCHITTAFSRQPILLQSSFPPRFAKSARHNLTMPFLPAPVQRQTIP